MKALLDGDIILYRCSASCEPTKIKPFVEEEVVAIKRAEDLVARILLETKADDYTMYLGGSTNYRYSIYPDYKGNRKEDKPTHYHALRRYLLDTYKCITTEDIETDDALCIEQYEHGDESVICSIDKDLLQVPGHHYNFVKSESSYISAVEGNRNFYKQLIAGDGADNIPSYDGKVRNAIPKFIQELLNPLDSLETSLDMYEHCLELYSRGWCPSSKQFIMHRNAQLLYLLRTHNDTWLPPIMNPGLTPDTTLLSLVSSEPEADDILLNTKY